MPLRILLAAIGSSGDVHPVLELGRALKQRGHEVTVTTNDMFSEQVEAMGLGFISLGTREEANAIMRDPRLWHPYRGFRCIVDRAILPNIARLYRIIERHRGPGAVVGATTLCLGARVAQDSFGVPTATLHLQSSVFRSHVDNGRLGRFDMGPGMPRSVKSVLFWLMDTLYVERAIGPELNAFRAAQRLPPVRGIFRSYVHSPELVLGLFPEWLAASQVDWPKNTHLTGFLLHDAGGNSETSREADVFLDAGPPPVLVTPGSAATDRSDFFRQTVAACAANGVRAMLVTNHPEQLPDQLPPGIRAFSYLPFSRVLPRCSAIIYHGGIGTLAQAVKAAVPHLVVPNAHDQPDNGQRIERLGLGFSIFPRNYGKRSAAGAIAALVNAPEIRKRCQEYAPKVNSAASSEIACRLIEKLAEGREAPAR